MFKKATAKLKNKGASDRLGWRAEWLKEGEEEIVKSLSILFNKIEREQGEHSYNGGKQQSKVYLKVVIRLT